MSSRIDERYRSYISKWEKVGFRLKRVLIILFLATVFIQFLKFLTIEELPPSSAIKLEGKAIIDNLFGFTEGVITLKADRYDRELPLKILINGVEKFTFDKQSITFVVNEADIIEVDGINSFDKINITVQSVSDNISIPNEGFSYQINRNLVYLFRVKMRF